MRMNISFFLIYCTRHLDYCVKDMKVQIKILFIVLMLICQNLYAVEVKRLYEVEVVAKSEKSQDKNLAIRQALKIVLGRIMAGKNIYKDNRVETVLLNAKNYVSEFQFSMGRTSEKENDSTRTLRVLFNEKLLVNTLRDRKNGIWNEIRPRTLIWLVVENKGKQRIFDKGLMRKLDLVLNKASKQKGLPVIYPIQDLDEKLNLSIRQILSAYSERLLDVSLRYDVVSTLAGRMVNKGECWQAEWTHYFDTKIKQWRSPCGSLSQVALKGFQGIYDNLSMYYAAKPVY